MKTKHTVGQWEVNIDHSREAGCYPKTYVDCNGMAIAKCYDKRWTIGKDEAESNAQLIAAAPILYNAAYSALQAIYAMPKKKQGFYQYLINDLLDAIQKADGTRI